MKRLLSQERGGIAILMVLSFMVLGIPVISSALNLADAFSRDSGVKTNILKPGESEILRFTADRDGIFNYACTLHPRMMTGKFQVNKL